MDNRAKGKKPIQDIKEFDELRAQAQGTKPDYDQAMEGFLDDLRNQNPGQYDSVVFHPADLKKSSRIADKIKSDYGGNVNEVADFVRGTFTADTPEQLLRVQEALEEKFEIVRVKDNIFEPMGGGLRNFNNSIRMSNGHIVETQVMPQQLWDVKGPSHDLMEQAQDLKRAGAPKTEIEVYDKANRLLQNGVVHNTADRIFLTYNVNPEYKANNVFQ